LLARSPQPAARSPHRRRGWLCVHFPPLSCSFQKAAYLLSACFLSIILRHVAHHWKLVVVVVVVPLLLLNFQA
jgi:hypothetical protein